MEEEERDPPGIAGYGNERVGCPLSWADAEHQSVVVVVDQLEATRKHGAKPVSAKTVFVYLYQGRRDSRLPWLLYFGLLALWSNFLCQAAVFGGAAASRERVLDHLSDKEKEDECPQLRVYLFS